MNRSLTHVSRSQRRGREWTSQNSSRFGGEGSFLLVWNLYHYKNERLATWYLAEERPPMIRVRCIVMRIRIIVMYMMYCGIGCGSASAAFQSAPWTAQGWAGGYGARSTRVAQMHPVQSANVAWKQNLGTLRPYANARAASLNSATSAGRWSGSPYTIDSLLARRALNPMRFDRFHPRLGLLLARDLRLRAAASQGCLPMNGLLAPTAYHRYLQWRRALNPARFDHFHPILGPLLAEDNQLRNSPFCPQPGYVTPSPSPSPYVYRPPIFGHITPPPLGTGYPYPPSSPGGGGGGVPGGGGGGNPVPEPSAWALLLLGGASASLVRWRRRRASHAAA